VDPVFEGSANAYDYCGQDPLNCSDLGGTYSYTYNWDLGSIADLGNAAQVMVYFRAHFKDVFPFPITGCKTLTNGSTCDLHAGFYVDFINGNGTVRLSNVTAEKLYFTVTSRNYFDPPGSSITFQTYDSGGQVYLRQSGNAPGRPQIYADIAYVIWGQQAANLAEGDYGARHPCTWDCFIAGI